MSDFKRGLQESRGLQNIKTTTGLVGARKIRKPHEAYIELSSLELEKHRLYRERKRAESRVHDIDKRLGEIKKKEIALHNFIERPDNVESKKDKKRKKIEPIPSYSAAPVEIKERAMTY